MKKGSPISLFSFQDIITCLTGIMIVIVLIILLQLVEATVGVQVNSGDKKRLEELKQLEKELIMYQENVSAEMPDDEAMEDVAYSEYTAEELRTQLEDAKVEYRGLMNSISALKAKIQSIDLKDLQNEKKNLYTKLSEDQKKSHQLQLLQDKIADAGKKAEELRNKIEKKKKNMRFEIKGSRDVDPIIIECNSWGFRIQKYPDGKVITIGERSSQLPLHIPAMVKHVQTFDRNKYYPLLLFREEALKHSEAIMDEFYNAFGYNVSVGKELLKADEECFYDE